MSGADAGVRVTPLTGASAVSSAHSELLVLVRRRTCDVQSVAMRLYRHATPAGQQAVIKAIIKVWTRLYGCLLKMNKEKSLIFKKN